MSMDHGQTQPENRMQYGWADCPRDVREQVEGFVDAVRRVLGDNLIGVYLHGSLAMGAFNPRRSDVDLLVVTKAGMPAETSRRVAELLLRYSKSPAPIEISFLRQRDFHPWEYPTTFDLHYSEDWREDTASDLARGAWEEGDEQTYRDPDLAAHIVMTLHRGARLYAKPIREVFPQIPAEHFVASIMEVFDSEEQLMADDPVYFVLNACRAWAYLLEGHVYSKDEGGVWALGVLPEEHRGLVARALEIYRRGGRDATLDGAALHRFADYVRGQVMPLLPTDGVSNSHWRA